MDSPIEVQICGIGTGIAQRRHGGQGISIVTGGDAGAPAEGDFASCLVWASRPGEELPILIIVTNNRWGISTPLPGARRSTALRRRGKAFGIRSKTIDGNDPATAYRELKAAMDYVRTERKPFLLEAQVSRLYGHSSASGANLNQQEVDCLQVFEEKLIGAGLLNASAAQEAKERYAEVMAVLARQVREEPQPKGDSIWKHIFAGRDNHGEHGPSHPDGVALRRG